MKFTPDVGFWLLKTVLVFLVINLEAPVPPVDIKNHDCRHQTPIRHRPCEVALFQNLFRDDCLPWGQPLIDATFVSKSQFVLHQYTPLASTQKLRNSTNSLYEPFKWPSDTVKTKKSMKEEKQGPKAASAPAEAKREATREAPWSWKQKHFSLKVETHRLQLSVFNPLQQQSKDTAAK